MSLHKILNKCQLCKQHSNLLKSVTLISIFSISDKEISALVVTEHDDVYALGRGSYGGIEYKSSITKITQLCKRRIQFIDITSENTFAITASGQLYIWGYGPSGIIGHGKQSSEATPCHVTALKDEKVIAISVVYHVLAVTETGKVFAWGFNGNKQIGNGTGYNRQLSPYHVNLKNEKIEQVAAGACHSLVSTGTKLFSWGYNAFGQLGDGTDISRATPVQVTNIPKGIKIIKIACGSLCSMALDDQYRVLYWGQRDHSFTGLSAVPTYLELNCKIVDIASYFDLCILQTEDDKVLLKYAALGAFTLVDQKKLKRQTIDEAFLITQHKTCRPFKIIKKDGTFLQNLNNHRHVFFDIEFEIV